MKLIGTMIVAAAIAVSGATAQTNSTVGDRKENQQDRIAQGVKSGQITAGGAANLETKEAAINQEVHTDRTLNGGKLTPQERTVVNQQQNQLSKQIYTGKHNAATQHYGNNEVDGRRENQQDRIANGIASGKLNAAQTARIENREAAVNHEVRTERAANGGKLTATERQQVNRQQNKLSKRIYAGKHR